MKNKSSSGDLLINPLQKQFPTIRDLQDWGNTDMGLNPKPHGSV